MQIVLLRQFVRQARICTINKLVKEIKRLRTNHGNEKQLERKKNKADRLLREALALKQIKDDEISKFGIISLENLQDTIQNPCSDDKTRAMAKVARYKSFNIKLMEFIEKYPNCKTYVSWKQKKRLQNKKRSSLTNEFHEETQKPLSNSESNINDMEFIEIVKGTDCVTDSFTDLSQCATKHENMKTNGKYNAPMKALLRYEQEKHGSNRQQLKENRKESTNVWTVCNIDEDQESKSIVKVISKEATVKRFTDILQEETSTKEIDNSFTENNSKQLSNKPVESLRKVDDFFLNSDEVISSSNSISCQERSGNKMSVVDNNICEVLRRKNGTSKFYNDETSVERRNRKMQDINGKGVFLNRNNIKPSTVKHSKQNEKFVRVKGKSIQGNSKITSTIENEKLHPSWIARKKQQEIMKQGFQGKIIRFCEN